MATHYYEYWCLCTGVVLCVAKIENVQTLYISSLSHVERVQTVVCKMKLNSDQRIKQIFVIEKVFFLDSKQLCHQCTEMHKYFERMCDVCMLDKQTHMCACVCYAPTCACIYLS
jgi:hypothetical protein